MSNPSLRSLIWSAFRRGGLVSVAVVVCRRSRTGLALSFVFRSRLVARGFMRRWQCAGALVGGEYTILIPVAGCIPFGSKPRPIPAAGGLRALPVLITSIEIALL